MGDAGRVCATNATRADTGRVLQKKRVNERDSGVCLDSMGRVLPHLAGPRPASSSRLSSPCCCSWLSPNSCGSWSLHSIWGMSTCEHGQRLRGRRRARSSQIPLLPPRQPWAPLSADAACWGPAEETGGAGTGTTRTAGILCLEHRRTEVGRPEGAGVRTGAPDGVLGGLG